MCDKLVYTVDFMLSYPPYPHGHLSTQKNKGGQMLVRKAFFSVFVVNSKFGVYMFDVFW